MVAAKRGTIIVTGANGVLGSALAEEIASRTDDNYHSHFHSIYTVRDATSAPNVTAALTRGTEKLRLQRISAERSSDSLLSSEILSLDLTKLDNVRQVAEGINARVSAGQIPPIRALILNAGLLEFGQQTWTDDGLDTTFASNYLGHWLLTLLLLKSMKKEEEKSPAARILFIGSQSHDPEDRRNAATKAFDEERYKTFVSDEASFEAIAKGTWSPASEDTSFPNIRSGFRRYGAAKLFLVMMMYELQRRIDQEPELKNICVLGVDPGTMISGLQRHAPWVVRVLMFQIINPIRLSLNSNGAIRHPRKAAFYIMEAALRQPNLATELEVPPKAFYVHYWQMMETSAESKDAQKQTLVWKETVKLAQLKEGDTILSHWQ